MAKFFRYRAAFVEPPQDNSDIPPVRITFPNGDFVDSNDKNINSLLSNKLKRNVYLSTPTTMKGQFEGYVPAEIEELADKGTIFSRISPDETFFDIATVHIITTSTINYLRKLAPESRIEPRRFRPNLIIEMPDTDCFIEKDWIGKTLMIGDVQLKITQETKRCVMTTLAQGDLPNDLNVLRQIVKNNAGGFGVYASVVKSGVIRVEEQVEII